ncbi:hypothetical protein ABZP36_005428 [Zizania latifolia]
MTMTSSSRRGAAGLRGPRPQPLKVSAAAAARNSSKKAPHGGPVIVYEHTPKVVHARPQEFTTVVQRLTGKPAKPPAAASTPSASPPMMQPATSVYAPAGFSPAAVVEEGAAACGDPLLLTLGQRQLQAVPPPPAAGMLLSPGFIFSPNTMQSIQELRPLF